MKYAHFCKTRACIFFWFKRNRKSGVNNIRKTLYVVSVLIAAMAGDERNPTHNSRFTDSEAAQLQTNLVDHMSRKYFQGLFKSILCFFFTSVTMILLLASMN